MAAVAPPPAPGVNGGVAAAVALEPEQRAAVVEGLARLAASLPAAQGAEAGKALMAPCVARAQSIATAAAASSGGRGRAGRASRAALSAGWYIHDYIRSEGVARNSSIWGDMQSAGACGRHLSTEGHACVHACRRPLPKHAGGRLSPAALSALAAELGLMSAVVRFLEFPQFAQAAAAGGEAAAAAAAEAHPALQVRGQAQG